jgi:hypothetical protein
MNDNELSNWTDDQLEHELIRRECLRNKREDEVYRGERDECDAPEVMSMASVDGYWGM